MSDKAFILCHPPYNDEADYALELQWEKPLLAIVETEPGLLPDPLVFEGNLAELEGNDYPSNSFHWPIMSRRMLNILLSVGPFPHRTIPVGVRDKQTGQVDTEKYVAVQLTEHLDLFDEVNSEYFYLDGSWGVIDLIRHSDAAQVAANEGWLKIYRTIALTERTQHLPPLFRLTTYPWLVLVSTEVRMTLEAAGTTSIIFQGLCEPRHRLDEEDDPEFIEDYAPLDELGLSPAELHEFASRYNWDDGQYTPLQIIRDPLCPKGTALLLYWRACPGWYLQFATEEAIDKWARSGYDLIKEIERRYQNNFYHYDTVFYTPTNDDGSDKTQPYPDVKVAPGQKIPDTMYEATGPR